MSCDGPPVPFYRAWTPVLISAPVLPVLAGCAAVTTLEGERLAMTSPEFRAYVESVFREQNRVATSLLLALESADLTPRAAAALEDADAGLLGACAGLNEIAIVRRDGRELERLEAARFARQAPECERATRAAEGALDAID